MTPSAALYYTCPCKSCSRLRLLRRARRPPSDISTGRRTRGRARAARTNPTPGAGARAGAGATCTNLAFYPMSSAQGSAQGIGEWQNLFLLFVSPMSQAVPPTSKMECIMSTSKATCVGLFQVCHPERERGGRCWPCSCFRLSNPDLTRVGHWAAAFPCEGGRATDSGPGQAPASPDPSGAGSSSSLCGLEPSFFLSWPLSIGVSVGWVSGGVSACA